MKLKPDQIDALPRYQEITATLKAGEERSVGNGTDFLALISASDKTKVGVRFAATGSTALLREGVVIEKLAVPGFYLVNLDTVNPNTITVAIGSARIYDNRQLNGQVAQDVNVDQLDGGPASGAQASAGSLPVVIATDQAAVPVSPHARAADRWAYAAAAAGLLNSVVPVPIIAAAVGKTHYLTGVQIQAEALTNATELVISDDTAGTVRFRYKIPAATAQGLVGITFPCPIAFGAGKGLEFATLAASGAGAVYLNAQGFTV